MYKRKKCSSCLLIFLLIFLLYGCTNAIKDNKRIHINISVQCKEALEFIDQKGGDAPSLNFKDGIILDKSNIEVSENESVLEILKIVLEENNITLKLRSGGYVAGIAGLVEKDKYFGEQSGWLYYVNGERPSVGTSQYIVKSGDVIEFRYVCKYTGF